MLATTAMLTASALVTAATMITAMVASAITTPASVDKTAGEGQCPN